MAMNKLLLVDDERWVRAALRHSIERLNKPFTVVHECSQGLEALDWLDNNHVDLVLSDIRMPVMDGLTFVGKLRQQKKEPDVILITVHDDFQCIQQALRHGVFDYLLKPVDQQELADCLDKWLAVKASKPAAPPAEKEVVDPSPVARVLQYIKKTAPGEITLTEAARQVHMNPSYLSQLFKQEMQVNFVDYVTALRMKEAKELLTGTTLRVSEVSDRLGYGDLAYFSNFFKKHTGMTPSEYRKSHKCIERR